MDAYKKIVFDFADKVENFCGKSKKKNLPTYEFSRTGYINFWREWNNRRNSIDH